MCILFLIPESRGHRVYMSELICMIMCRLCIQGSELFPAQVCYVRSSHVGHVQNLVMVLMSWNLA